MIWGDASDFAYGGYLCMDGKELPFHKYMEPHERSESSTFRELKSIEYAIECYGSLLKNRKVHYITDNQARDIICAKGSSKVKLHLVAHNIYTTCTQFGINFSTSWAPRSMNVRADSLSKTIDRDDWGISPDLFALIEKWSGLKFDLDCFANDENKKCDKYFSLFYEKNSAAVDAFSLLWTGHVCWVVPPPSQAAKALFQMKNSGVKGAFVCPKWPKNPAWTLLLKDNFSLHIVRKYEVLGAPYLIEGRGGNDVFGKSFKGYIGVFYS